jgi:hypothetical protein
MENAISTLKLDDYQTLLRADAHDVAKRTLRGKFGRLSNRRILNVLRPVADQIQELRGRSDAQILEDWFVTFTACRSTLKRNFTQRRPHVASA